jgi:glyoxylase-like metal-dependent hydrolase (beta-lactamase superfamily II)
MSATSERTASERIDDEVTSWPGVTAGHGERGEYAFRLGRRELGHLHGDRVFHSGFPKAVWHELHEQGRIDFHPVFPGRPGFGARVIENDDDVRDVIAMLRLNYDRAARRHGVPAAVPGLHALSASPLQFAPGLEVRAFLLERDHGNVLLYDAPATTAGEVTALGGAARRYLGHWHEASLGAEPVTGVPLFVHAADLAQTERHRHVRGAFSRRHTLDDDLEVIPIPGHTPGSTAYLWTTGGTRVLFTADTLYLGEDGEWVVAVLESSDRGAYLESVELLRDLEFDVLAPWAAPRGSEPVQAVGRDEARRRLSAIMTRVWEGATR